MNKTLFRRMNQALRLAVGVFALAGIHSSLQAVEPQEKPLMKDFIGLNGHLHFKPELYQPICSRVRNYHPVIWDLPKDTSKMPQYPLTTDTVEGKIMDWSKVFKSWKEQGFVIDDCLQFETKKLKEWKNIENDSYAYGLAYAKYFGPSGQNMVASAEIGNEPAEYDDATYRKIFENMGKGLREGDPKLKIVTAAAAAGTPDTYSKSVLSFQGLEKYYDVLNVHTYAQIEQWPTWKRTYPEHENIPYVAVIQEMIDWRNKNAPGKEIWVTEFGYDASLKTNPPWVGVTETEQAQWIIRSYLVFSSMDVDAAYLYYYDDEGEPAFHASAGLTRHFKPKPSYYAVAHLQKTLGDYRFSKVIKQEKDDLYVYEYTSPTKPKEPVLVAWLPTGSKKEAIKQIPVTGQAVKAEQMPLKSGNPEEVPLKASEGNVELALSESPTYIFLKLP